MRMRQIGKALLYPHKSILALLVPCAGVLLGYTMYALGTEHIITYGTYALAAYTLTVLCVRVPHMLRAWHTLKEENKYLHRLLNDTHLRVSILLYGTLSFNTVWALFHLGLGIYQHSAWFYSLAAYYVLLALMRFFLLAYLRGNRPGEHITRELKKYRACGILLLCLQLLLALSVFDVIRREGEAAHHEIVTITMAAYTFGVLSAAIVSYVRYRRYQSPVLSAVKVVSLATALVSMLTLERAMLATFGAGGSDFARLITGVSGTAVVAFVLALAIYMIVSGTKKLKINQQES